jgi:hypothetical protein
MGQLTRYWSIADKNERLLPLAGVLLQNRLLWLAVGLTVLALAYRRFAFGHALPERARRGAAPVDLAPEERLATPGQLRLPRVARAFGARARLAQFASIASRAFMGIVRNRYFVAIVGAALLFLVFTAHQAGNIFGTPTWPVTYQTEELLSGTFGIFVLAVITFYAGELVWEERDVHVNQIQDATPVPTSITFLAKLAALIAVIALVLAIMLICGIVMQAAKGYFNFEIGLYLKTLFGIRLVDYVLLVVLAMAIHVLVNHKYVGHFLVLLFYVGTALLPQLGLDHNLYAYGSDGGMTYSDMNRFGPYLGPLAWWKLYWAAFAILLALLSNLLWVRGQETLPGWRMHLARLRFTRPLRAMSAVASLGFIGLGGFIFYNTNVLNEHRTAADQRRLRAEYERRYKRFEGAPQPEITAVRVAVDLFPRERAARVRGSYVLRNRDSVAIDTVHLRLSHDMRARLVAFDRSAQRVLDDRPHDYAMYRLATPLAPGDSLVLRFDLERNPRGFANRVADPAIAENGSFIASDRLVPGIGYARSAELEDDDERKKEGLAPRARLRPPEDRAARMHTYVDNAGWVTFDATVSTSPDQIAIAPGYLQREWTADGRRYFHYTMDAPILNFYAFQSARYGVKRDVWTRPTPEAAPADVAIEVYYHPGHEYNLDRMIRSVKRSLDYFTANFGPYQHRQVRIIEFPRYAQFAQSFPNTIPYSESIGFIARIRDANDIDYPFYVTAHEVAHQWWAHQVIGGEVQGSTMLSETLAQYSALMVMEKEYGPTQMRKFLEYELDRYLFGRSTERKKEQPLALVEDQPYIHYRKGSLAMYALRDYIGEDKLNGALKRFVRATRFQSPPYTTSRELLDTLAAVTPDSLRYVLDDLFERITLYELRTDSATVTRAADGQWVVDVAIDAKKLYADSLGRETEAAMSDWIDIGVYADTGRGRATGSAPVYLRKHRIASGPQRIQVTVDRKPTRAGIDPLHKLVDRQTSDNVRAVKEGG